MTRMIGVIPSVSRMTWPRSPPRRASCRAAPGAGVAAGDEAQLAGQGPHACFDGGAGVQVLHPAGVDDGLEFLEAGGDGRPGDAGAGDRLDQRAVGSRCRGCTG